MHSLVKDLTTTQVVTAGPATPFKELVARLATQRVSAVPVVDEDRPGTGEGGRRDRPRPHDGGRGLHLPRGVGLLIDRTPMARRRV